MALNDDLAKASVYGKLDHKQVTAWLNLWNNAAHGDYDTYNRDQVRLVLQGVTEWLARMTVQCACVFIEAEEDNRAGHNARFAGSGAGKTQELPKRQFPTLRAWVIAAGSGRLNRAKR